MKKALIVVDIQNDFISGGALPTKEGDKIIPVVNQLMDKFGLVAATQDWHPATHGSFASNHAGKTPGEVIELQGLQQILWPDHCVQESPGAEFAQGLNTDKFDKVFQKGTDPEIDSYSGFFDNGKKKDTGLNGYLSDQQIDTVYIVGLATDYCVKFTALDAIVCGYTTYVVKDATKAVNLSPDDYENTLEELENKGVKIVVSGEIA